MIEIQYDIYMFKTCLQLQIMYVLFYCKTDDIVHQWFLLQG